MDPTNVSLTLMIDTKEQRVLFANADKDFVDFIFSLLIVPMGRSNVGCLPKIYRSVKDFKNDYMISELQKDILLHPTSPMSFPLPELSSKGFVSPQFLDTKTLYQCDRCIRSTFFSSSCVSRCPDCRHKMSTCVEYYVYDTSPPSLDIEETGFVKGGMAKYMVMDDLSVTDFDPSSILLLFKKMNINNLDAIEEKVVRIGKDKARELMKLALSSSNRVLTNVFLGEAGTSGSKTNKRVKKEG